MLGSTQLAGSHCGEWSPEAVEDALHPGDLGEQDPSLPVWEGIGEQGETGLSGDGGHQIHSNMSSSCQAISQSMCL